MMTIAQYMRPKGAAVAVARCGVDLQAGKTLVVSKRRTALIGQLNIQALTHTTTW